MNYFSDILMKKRLGSQLLKKFYPQFKEDVPDMDQSDI